MDTICVLAILCIIAYVGFKIHVAIEKSDREHQDKIDSIKTRFNRQKSDFDSTLSSFFFENHNRYLDTYSTLTDMISKMRRINSSLTDTSKNDDYSNVIDQYSCLASDFFTFGEKVNQLPFTRMMDAPNYGKIQKQYWESVRSLSKSAVDNIMNGCERSLSSKSYSQIFAIDIDVILQCVWFYAIEKPYSAESFKKAVSIFECLSERHHVDITIAGLYAMKQMGGEDALRDRIRNMLKNNDSTEELTLIASALMWMNAYQAENMILQHMLSAGMQMTAKTQERLHSLTNGGGKAPSGFNVSSSGSSMYFDVSALAWKDDEYMGLFENLAFQEKELSYSLAVRDENEEISISQGVSIPGTSAVLRKLNSVFAEEYGNTVTATLRNCIALSGSGEEQMEGIVVESDECKQMGILVYVARIGKKVNIKFYTLFMPRGTRLADQNQQVLSLYKKLSPSVTMWESSMKDTVLMAIQQLLNSAYQSTFTDGDTFTDSEEPIF